ncbi:MAG: PQQ-binding-like beta-propeller repeat protein [Actinobacteria bacterium]|nr:PQQ-binding-like beta-propeller repeat protein [Actinomycetota bacterium]
MNDRLVVPLKVLVFLFFLAVALFFTVMTVSGFRQPPVTAEENGGGNGDAGGVNQRAWLDALKELDGFSVRHLRQVWELGVPGKVYLAADDGTLYASSSSGSLYCIDATTGSVRWSYNLGSWISTRPLVSKGVVYVGSANRFLYALDAQTGALLWFFQAQGEIISTPVESEGVVFFFADNDSVFDLVNRLYALDARGGTLLWSYDTKSWTPSPPAVGGNAVFIGGSKSEAMALEKYTGKVIWSRQLDSVVFSSPCINGTGVLFSTANGWLYSLDEATGEPLWQRNISAFTPTSPLAVGDSLYINSYQDKLTALALEDGNLRWTLPDAGMLVDATTPPKGSLFAFSAKGVIYWIEPSSGKRRGVLLAPFPFAGAPLIHDGRVFAVSPDGMIRAYKTEDGVPFIPVSTP